MSSLTPRTDSQSNHASKMVGYDCDVVSAVLSRELESELIKARAERDVLRAAMEALEEALKLVEAYLVERGIEHRGTIGRTRVLPAIRQALAAAQQTGAKDEQ